MTFLGFTLKGPALCKRDWKFRLPALAVLVLILGAASPGLAATGITGVWATGILDGRVLIHPCGQVLCGRIIDGAPLRANPDQRDIRNPDPHLRNRKIKGLVVLRNITGGPWKWEGGPVYNPVTGERASRATLRLLPDGRLEVKGCVLFLCRTKVWTRVR